MLTLKQCHHVHRYRPQDQCAFVKDVCLEEEVGLFSYLTLYYCRIPHIKPLGFTIIAIWTALLFTTIGVAASDFFCINLSTISSLLGLSESVAGVTFLAFGNGSPDVFSTFAAVKSHSGSLAIGELIGAAGFITAVVSGSMALIRPFHVYKRSFLRDVGFFIVSVAFSMVFLANGALELWECAVMVTFYVFYVFVVVGWHWYLTRRRNKRDRETAARGHYTVAETDEIEGEEEYHDEDEPTPRKTGSRPVSIQDFDALERASYLEEAEYEDLDDEQTRDKWMGELSNNMRVTKPPARQRNAVFTPIRPSLVGALEFRAVLSSLQKSRNISTPPPISMRRYSDAPYYTTAQQQENTDDDTDVEGAQGAYETSLREQSILSRHSTLSNRGRAVSANDASTLRLNRDAFRNARSSSDLLGEPAIQEHPSEVYGTFRSQNAADMGAASPHVSITSPPREQELIPESRARANTADLLAPPDAQIYPHRRSQSVESSPAGPKPQRPRLAIPGGSRRSSPKVSPLHSPMLAALSRSDSGIPSILLPESNDTPNSALPFHTTEKISRWWPSKVLPSPSLVLRALFPTLSGWTNKSIAEKVLGICTAPSFFLLTITLPVVEPAEESDSDLNKATAPTSAPSHPHSSTATTAVNIEASRHHGPPMEDATPPPPSLDHTSKATSNSHYWNRWLVLIQAITSPFFIVLVFWANFSEKASDLLLPSLYSLLASLCALVLLLTTTVPTRPPKWHFMLTFLGFAVAIAWISTIANEVVGVLKTIGVIFNMSDAILGLTIFAVGNSLGDLVADITVARLGYPVMALSACFGGPMLNILLGIGLSGLYMIVDKGDKKHARHPDRPVKFKPYHVQVSTTLLISAIALLVTLVGLLVVVPLNGWKMDRRIGIGLIALWVISTVGNVIVEVTGAGDDLMDELVRSALFWRR